MWKRWVNALSLSVILSSIASSSTAFLLPFIAVYFTQANPLQLGMLTSLPSLLIAIFATTIGGLIDRTPKTNAIVGANLFRLASLLGLIAFFVYTGAIEIHLIIIAACIIAVASIVHQSALTGILPELFNKRQRILANSAFTSINTIGEVSGPAVAGILLKVVASPLVLLSDCAMYLISILIVKFVPEKESLNPDTVRRTFNFAYFSAGMTTIFKNSVLRAGVLNAGQYNFCISMINTLLIYYCYENLHLDSTQVTIIAICSGVGSYIAVFVINQIPTSFQIGKIFFLFPLLAAGAQLVISQAEKITDKNVCIMVMGIAMAMSTTGISMCQILLNNVCQAQVPSEKFNRTFTGERCISKGCESLGGITAGILGSYVATHRILVGASIGLALSIFWLYFRSNFSTCTQEKPVPEKNDATVSAE